MTKSFNADCVFCRILANEQLGSFVYRDADLAVIMDIYPITSGHMLIIPTQHAADLHALAPDVAGLMLQKAQDSGQALLRSDLGCPGYNLFLANGSVAGQDVFHVHLHIIPRYEDDGFGFVFPKHYPQQAKRTQLEQQAQVLKAALL